MLVRDLVNRALERAQRGSEALSNPERSSRWVDELAAGFREAYSAQQRFRVFSRRCNDHKAQFGLNELLFDISVCHVGDTISARHKHSLEYVDRAVWAVESELEADSRAAAVDFSKLVMSSAANKLFIGPVVSDPEAYLAVLRPIASACSGRKLVALVPHPTEWKPGTGQVAMLWVLPDDLWRPGDDEYVR